MSTKDIGHTMSTGTLYRRSIGENTTVRIYRHAPAVEPVQIIEMVRPVRYRGVRRRPFNLRRVVDPRALVATVLVTTWLAGAVFGVYGMWFA